MNKVNKVKAEIVVNPMTFEPRLHIGVNGKFYTVSVDYLEYLNDIGETAIDGRLEKDDEINKKLDEENNYLKARVGKLEKTLSRVKKHIKY